MRTHVIEPTVIAPPAAAAVQSPWYGRALAVLRHVFGSISLGSGIARRLAASLCGVLLLAGCSSGGGATGIASPAPSAIATPDPSAAGSASPTVPGPSASSAPGGDSDGPAVVLTQPWATAPLVDVASGETFRIADHAGSVIIIETMAIWCSNCLVQQRSVDEALTQLPAERVVYVVLDVDPNEDGASLAAYREANGLAGRYAVAGPDLARALAADFGDLVLDPPSTPIVFVGTDGTVTRTDFGLKSADEIIELALQHGA